MEKRLPKLLRFATRVLRDFFMRNHGLLLTAAVANNMMLSLIPLSAVLIVVLSHFYQPAALIDSIRLEVTMIAPGLGPILAEALEGFLRSREVVGWVGLGSLLIFSSFAFRVLEDSIAIIFHRPLPTLKRKFWISALMPYFFIAVIAAGLIAITTATSLIEAQVKSPTFPAVRLLIQQHLDLVVYVFGMFGMILLFTLFYKVMPVARINFHRALVGGVTATILWEIVRHMLVFYYNNVSIVNVLYGSMATLIIILLTMEAISLILLLGAQVIADLQRSADWGVAWYEDPDES